MTRSKRASRGFALLMVLLLVMLVAALTLAAARTSVQRASEAQASLRELQQVWGVQFLQRAVLPRVERELVLEGARRGEPVARCERRVQLGVETFLVVLADEQSKANVNKLVSQMAQVDAEARMRALLSSAGVPSNVEFHPLTAPIGGLQRFGHYGQVLADWPGGAGHTPDRVMRTAALVTLWGDGRVNAMRAPREVLMASVPELDLGHLEQLLRLRRRSPIPSWPALLDQLDMRPEQRAAIDQLLTGQSRCHSVLILVEHENRYHLAVTATGGTQEQLDW